MAKQRDYKAEYQRRVTCGFAKGLSRTQARGHASRAKPVAGDAKLEKALAALREGKSLTAAASKAHVSPERFRQFVREGNLARLEGRRWVVADNRARGVPIFSKRKRLTIIAANYEQAALAGRYWDAAHRFVASNDMSLIEPFVGQSVRDAKGKLHPLETDPNAIHRLAAAGGPAFHEIYRLTQ
jgi:hypothetical protein